MMLCLQIDFQVLHVKNVISVLESEFLRKI